MRILVVNNGSSSIKLDWIEVAADKELRLASGTIRLDGDSANVTYRLGTFPPMERRGEGFDSATALREFLDWLGAEHKRRGLPKVEVDAVGHRIVHGGPNLRTPTRIDDSILAELDRVTPLAPLHNPPAMEGIQAAEAALGARIPAVAVFDTAFHATLPTEASTYALPRAMSERFGIRRYGFHGIAHESLMRSYVAASGRTLARSRLITLQLGQGCSAAAIRDGESIDTSMGFTPLEGLMMGTRPGDLDPGIVPFLTGNGALSPDQVEQWLSKECGWLGVSGLSSDFGELWKARDDSSGAALAINTFCYRVRKYVGAYMASLGGADAILFGGGIGENQPGIRSAVCRRMEWCGLRLDERKNQATVGQTGLISTKDSAVQVWVFIVDEACLIARKTFALLSRE